MGGFQRPGGTGTGSGVVESDPPYRTYCLHVFPEVPFFCVFDKRGGMCFLLI